ncbi:flavin reductase [Actinoplanes sp. NPDC051851]|uniref:flavin reductase n=1 Tax=Actinoplanes sp. NPDC051851 TaxID=3154753 RepID=UPI00343E8AA3
MPVDSTTFRSVLGQWPSGVCVVTTAGPHGAHGMTASSFSSVSLDPPMVSVCLGNHLPSRSLLEAAGRFAISFLGKDQAHIGRRFAGQDRDITDRFAGFDWVTTPNGCPVLADAVAWLDCRIAYAYPGGDHTIFVGEVTEAATPRVGAPLLFHSRNWGQLADPLPEGIHLAVDVPAGDPLADTLRRGGARVRADGGCFEFPAGGPDGLPHPERIIAARQAGTTVIGYVPDAFDPSREDEVLATAGALSALGCDEIGLLESETVPASPLQVRRVLQDAVVRARPAALRVRLAGNNRLALVNALVAMKSGVSCFDVVAPGSPASGLPLGDLLHLSRQLEVGAPIGAADVADRASDLAQLRE